MGETNIRDAFRHLLFRPDALTLIVAVVIGTAVWSVASAFVSAFVMPALAMFLTDPVGRERHAFELSITINNTVFPYGFLFNAVISLFLVAVVLHALVLKPFQETTRDCPHCLSRIPVAASACAFCARDVPLPVASGR